jgi:hypothetical protein
MTVTAVAPSKPANSFALGRPAGRPEDVAFDLTTHCCGKPMSGTVET